jgi:[acyl-carrier-protein] S-malonyltransferase
MSAAIAILCPGQGAQAVGMGRAWAEASAEARSVFEQADRLMGDALGAPLSRLCFEGPAERLNRTDVSQPAIFTCSVACWAALTAGGGRAAPAAAAGLSLGEYTALHLAGAFGFADGLRLVAERGRLMQAAAEASDGAMVALIGADEAAAQALCRDALEGANGRTLLPANFNAPGQIVLSGDREASRRAVELAAAAGIRAAPLAVAGAFHSDLMAPAAEGLARVLGSVELDTPRHPVWSNVTGRPHEPENPELLRQRLVEQLVRPVRWMHCCRAMVEAGYTAFLELAPGAVLRGLMRRTEPKAEVHSHDQPKT